MVDHHHGGRGTLQQVLALDLKTEGHLGQVQNECNSALSTNRYQAVDVLQDPGSSDSILGISRV